MLSGALFGVSWAEVRSSNSSLPSVVVSEGPALSGGHRFVLGLFTDLVSFTTGLNVKFLVAPFVIRRVKTRTCNFINLTGAVVGCTALFALTLGSMSKHFVAITCRGKSGSATSGCFASALSSGLIVITVLAVVTIPLV